MSWLSGNSFAQTLGGCLYAHPTALSTLRSLCGLPPHMHGLEASASDLPRRVTPEGGVGSVPAPAPSAPLPAGAASAPLPAGAAARSAAYAVAAYATAVLKSCELNHRTVLRGDLWEEDDYYCMLTGVDVAWAVPLGEVFELLDVEQQGMIDYREFAALIAFFRLASACDPMTMLLSLYRAYEGDMTGGLAVRDLLRVLCFLTTSPAEVQSVLELCNWDGDFCPINCSPDFEPLLVCR
jgi:hypothetical protein